MAAAEDVAAEEAVGVGGLDRPSQRGDRVGVLRADVDVALARTDGVRRDRHALDEGERVSLDDHPVGEGAGVALVEVAGDELLVGRGLEHGLPLHAGGEPGAAAAAEPRVGDLLHDLGRRHRQRPPQPGPAALRLEALDVLGVDHADAGEGDAALTGQPGVVVDDAERVVAAREDVGRVVGRDVGVADATLVGLDLDQRLGPEHPARPVAPDGRASGLEGDGDLVGADGDGGRVAGHPDGRHDHSPVSCSSRAASSRPWSLPSSIPLGPSAQLPRQKTSRTSTSSRAS